jgi:hypothetical protein
MKRGEAHSSECQNAASSYVPADAAYQVEDGHVNAPDHAAFTIDHQTAIDH